MGALGAVTLDLSLARGLDYYTGLIYEAVLKVRVGACVRGRALGGGLSYEAVIKVRGEGVRALGGRGGT